MGTSGRGLRLVAAVLGFSILGATGAAAGARILHAQGESLLVGAEGRETRKQRPARLDFWTSEGKFRLDYSGGPDGFPSLALSCAQRQCQLLERGAARSLLFTPATKADATLLASSATDVFYRLGLSPDGEPVPISIERTQAGRSLGRLELAFNRPDAGDGPRLPLGLALKIPGADGKPSFSTARMTFGAPVVETRENVFALDQER